MLIRIEGFDLPGRTCGPGPDFPDGHDNVHVAVQGRKGQQDLYGLVPADRPSVSWELECAVGQAPEAELTGPQIQGSPGKRFIYITWGVVSDEGAFRMFRRAKLWLRDVPSDVMAAARARGLLVGRLALKDDDGWPVCASVHPPRIEWSSARSSLGRAPAVQPAGQWREDCDHHDRPQQ